MDQANQTSESGAIYDLVIAVTRLATAIEAVSGAVAASHVSGSSPDPVLRAEAEQAVREQLAAAREETNETMKAMRILVEGLADGVL